MNGAEASGLGFGIEVTGCLNVIVCGSCNTSIEHKKIFYVACINEVLCENCITDYVKNMSHYTDDDSIRYEINHFNIVAQKLGISEKAGLTTNKKIVINPKDNTDISSCDVIIKKKVEISKESKETVTNYKVTYNISSKNCSYIKGSIN